MEDVDGLDRKTIKRVLASRSSMRIASLASRTKRLCTGRYAQLAIRSFEFDHTEGEGEIKCIRWLAKTERCSLDISRVLMARDNDAYVYSLAVGARSLSICPVKRVVDSRVSTFDVAQSMFLIFHEPSGILLRCWRNLLNAYGSKSWVLILWIAVCFGNYYVIGIIDKSFDSIERCFDNIMKHFATHSSAFDDWSDDMFDDNNVRGIRAVLIAMMHLQRLLRNERSFDADCN